MLWGRNDQSITANATTTAASSNGAPLGMWNRVQGDHVNRTSGANAHYGNTSAQSRASVDVNIFNNTTIGAFIANMSFGVFGVDTTEIGVSAANLSAAYVTSAGGGYNANAVVTLTFANGTTNVTSVNAFANVTGNAGRITALNISIPGSIYVTSPALTVAAPAAVNITANTTGFSNTADTLVVASANSRFQVGDRVYYAVPASNTAIGGLTGNTYYYISFANTTVVGLSATSGGANVDITDARVTASAEVHTIQGDTAAGYVVVNGGKNMGIPHAGWNLRKEGTGGRAGRVHYECIVAMGSLGAQTAPYGTAALVSDASDSSVLP